MKTLGLIALACACLLTLGACALIFKGDSSTVTFNSNPSGVDILIDGAVVGTTPTQIKLKTNRSYTIIFRKAGLKDQTFTLTNRVGVLWIVLDVVSGLLPLAVDAATGAWYEFDQTNVNVVLSPTTMHHIPLPGWALELMQSKTAKF